MGNVANGSKMDFTDLSPPPSANATMNNATPIQVSSSDSTLSKKSLEPLAQLYGMSVEALKALCSDPQQLYDKYFAMFCEQEYQQDRLNIFQQWFTQSSTGSMVQEFEQYKKSIKNDMPIKLFISNLKDSNPHPLQRVVAQVATEYGLVHVGIQFGPYFIDWNTSEVCLPRLMKAANPVCIIDMKLNRELTKELCFKMCQRIAFWNNNMIYSILPLGHAVCMAKKYGSCHIFIRDMMKQLDLKPNWSKGGPIRKFLKEVKSKDKLVQRSFRNEVFETHEELDNYVRNKTDDPSFTGYVSSIPDVSFEEYELLKSFDRAFWARNHKTEHCPFNEHKNNAFSKTREFHFYWM